MEQLAITIVWGLLAGMLAGITGLSGILAMCAILMLLQHAGYVSPQIGELLSHFPLDSIEAALLAGGALGAVMDRHSHGKIPWGTVPSYVIGVIAGGWVASAIGLAPSLPYIQIVLGLVIALLSFAFLITGNTPGGRTIPVSSVAVTGCIVGLCLPWLGVHIAPALLLVLLAFHRLPICEAHAGAEIAALTALVVGQVVGLFVWPEGPGIRAETFMLVTAAFVGGRMGSQIAHGFPPVWVERFTALALSIAGLRIAMG